MLKVAVVVLAGTETHEGLARVVNAMVTAKELKEAGDQVRLVFDGAGTAWVGELAKPDHRAHRLYAAVRDRVDGACAYCARAFDATHDLERENVHLLDEYEHHPSLRALLVDGFQILTF
jgi:hypothetical protein